MIDDEVVVEDGKYVTTSGDGILGSLRIFERLHGRPWARLVGLAMEFQPRPDEKPRSRALLADLNLPSSIYGAFPWREAELTAYEGDTRQWTMTWSLDDESRPGLAESLTDGLLGEGWTLESERRVADGWTSDGSLLGRDGDDWRGDVEVTDRSDGTVQLDIRVTES